MNTPELSILVSWEENCNLKYPIFDENSFFVQFKAPNCEELKKFVLNKEETYTKFTWAEDCDVKTISCKWEETLELLRPSIDKFSESIGKSFKWRIYPPWINSYEKGGFQEIHDHVKFDFSCVFFPEIEEEFGKFYFYDRHGNSLGPAWSKLINPVTRWYPDIQSGDIIFFPSVILHGVSPHKSDKTRKTFACNFDFDLSK